MSNGAAHTCIPEQMSKPRSSQNETNNAKEQIVYETFLVLLHNIYFQFLDICDANLRIHLVNTNYTVSTYDGFV